MEGARAYFDVIGTRGQPIVHVEPGGTETWKPSRRGSDFAGRCVTKMGEAAEGSNGGG